MVEACTEFSNELQSEQEEIASLDARLAENETLLDSLNAETEGMRQLINELQDRINEAETNKARSQEIEKL